MNTSNAFPSTARVTGVTQTIGLRRRRLRQFASKLVAHAILLILGFVFSIPFFWLLTTSLKADRQIFAWPPVWLPNPVIWRNYPDVFKYAPFLLYFRNTMIVVAAHVFGGVVTCSLAAYAFARLKAPGRDLIFMVMISTMMIPGIVTLVPIYIIFAKLDWIDTFLPLTVPPLTGSAFFIFMLRQFYLTIPIELEEAALMDGATRWTIWWKLMLPLSTPALATVAVFAFMGAWNDFLSPLIFLNSRNLYTLTLGLNVFLREHSADWGLLMAASTMMVVPVIITFFLVQKQFVQGITLTGIKG